MDIEVTEEFFNREELVQDLENYQQWKKKAEKMFNKLNTSEETYKDKELFKRFKNLK